MEKEHWTEAPFIIFDTETTGTDIKNDRILQAAVVTHPGKRGILVEEDRVIYCLPDVEISKAATEIHGLTKEKLEELEAYSSEEGIRYISNFVFGRSTRRGYPLVIYNASFDYPLILNEMSRYGLIDDVVPYGVNPFILDPLVIDRALDKFRKGSRTLEAVSAHYGVKIDGGAHDALTDCKTTLGVMLALIEKFPELKTYSIQRMQDLQKKWFADWRDHLNEYFAKNGKTDRVVGDWPTRENQNTSGSAGL